jgi:hypothetical protein
MPKQPDEEKRPAENPIEPAAQRIKREWLAPQGRRQPRIGGDFQVAMLPSPSDKPQSEKKEHTAGETEETAHGGEVVEAEIPPLSKRET